MLESLDLLLKNLVRIADLKIEQNEKKTIDWEIWKALFFQTSDFQDFQVQPKIKKNLEWLYIWSVVCLVGWLVASLG